MQECSRERNEKRKGLSESSGKWGPELTKVQKEWKRLCRYKIYFHDRILGLKDWIDMGPKVWQKQMTIDSWKSSSTIKKHEWISRGTCFESRRKCWLQSWYKQATMPVALQLESEVLTEKLEEWTCRWHATRETRPKGRASKSTFTVVRKGVEFPREGMQRFRI